MLPTHLAIAMLLVFLCAVKCEYYNGGMIMSVYYENPSKRLADGKYCDFLWFDRQCDVYLKICVRTSPKGRCNLLDVLTHTSWQAKSVNYPILGIEVRDNTSDLFYITIEAWDFDDVSSDDFIARFHNDGYGFDDVGLQAMVIPMVRSDLLAKNAVSMTVTMRKV